MNVSEKFFELPLEGRSIKGVIHEPPLPPACSVLLLNGYFFADKVGPCRLFVRLARILASCGIRAIRFDYRGRGDSEGDFEETTFSSVLSDVSAVIKAYAAGTQVTLIGHSMGGNIAVAASRREAGVSRLVLISPHTRGATTLLFSEQQLSELRVAGSVERKGAICYRSFLDPLLLGNTNEEAALVDSDVLLIQGRRDEFYTYGGLLELASCFRLATHVLLEGDHNFTSIKSQNELLGAIHRWVCGKDEK